MNTKIIISSLISIVLIALSGCGKLPTVEEETVKQESSQPTVTVSTLKDVNVPATFTWEQNVIKTFEIRVENEHAEAVTGALVTVKYISLITGEPTVYSKGFTLEGGVYTFSKRIPAAITELSVSVSKNGNRVEDTISIMAEDMTVNKTVVMD